MVYTRRPATQAQAQANAATPAYSTMSTRNSASAGQYQQQPQTQYGNSVTTQPAANYQQSYSTTGYQTQTFTPAVTKPAPTPQPQAQAQQPLKAEDNNTAMETGEEGEKPKRKFQTGVRYKVNKRLKRAKRNDSLRRVIKPKNSIMCLHELISGLQFNVQDLPAAGHDQLPRFSVTLQAYGKTYEGIGSSKLIAKQIACENALKGILVDRMAKQAQREAEAKDEPMYDENGDSKDGKGNIPEDNIPWVSVASFALHKLFSEWQGQGTHLPLEGFGPSAAAAAASPKKAPPQVARPMPENPLHYQPTMLLHIVRPGVTYNDTSNAVSAGGAPSFTASCVVDGKTYTGTASKKKIARKNAAKAALLDMGVTYPPEA